MDAATPRPVLFPRTMPRAARSALRHSSQGSFAASGRSRSTTHRWQHGSASSLPRNGRACHSVRWARTAPAEVPLDQVPVVQFGLRLQIPAQEALEHLFQGQVWGLEADLVLQFPELLPGLDLGMGVADQSPARLAGPLRGCEPDLGFQEGQEGLGLLPGEGRSPLRTTLATQQPLDLSK